jgi:hypothetical protein
MHGHHPTARHARRATVLLLFCAAQTSFAQEQITPSSVAARGLPVRADTVDGLGGEKDARSWFGFYIYAVSRATIGAKPAYLVTMNYTSREKGSFQSDTLALDAATLTPLWRRFHARTDSASVTFAGRHATGWSLQNDRRVTIDYELSETSFAGPMLRWIAPALPLATGYQASLSTFNIWRNKEDKGTIAVSGPEIVDIGGKKYDALVIQSASGARTWVEKSTGRVLQVFTPNSQKGYWLVKR